MRKNVYHFVIYRFVLPAILLLTAGCAMTTRIVDIGNDVGRFENRRITIKGIVTRRATEPREINQVFDVLRFTFPAMSGQIPRKHYYFEINDGTGAIWVVSNSTGPGRGAIVRVEGVVRRVEVLPIFSTYNMVDIAGWKTLLPGEVTGDYVIVR